MIDVNCAVRRSWPNISGFGAVVVAELPQTPDDDPHER